MLGAQEWDSKLLIDDSVQSSGAMAFFHKLYARIMLCPRGKHRRSLRHIRKDGDHYTSRCWSCNVPMRRLSKRNWIVDIRRK